MPIENLSIPSGALRLAARLYRPDSPGQNSPLIVMAHGLGAEMNFGLPKIAQCFNREGWTVLMFDYRHWGESPGLPRELLVPKLQLEDWESALVFAQSLSGIDRKKIALWGTSFSGGHVLVTASRHPELAAVVAQVPFTDGPASALTYSPLFLLKAGFHAAWDLAVSSLNGKPHYLPLVGSPQELAVMNKADSREYYNFIPEGSQWENRAAARIAFLIPLYRPVAAVSRIKIPALIVYGEKDTLIPAKAVEKTIQKLPCCRALKLPMGHFEIYTDFFEPVMEAETAFFKEIFFQNPSQS